MIKLTNVNNFWTVWRTLYGLNLDSLLTTFTDGGNQSDALNWMSLMTSAFSYMDDIEGLDLSSMTDRFSSLMDSLGDATDALKVIHNIALDNLLLRILYLQSSSSCRRPTLLFFLLCGTFLLAGEQFNFISHSMVKIEILKIQYFLGMWDSSNTTRDDIDEP
eukprot:m.124739 g.124739  ORF g.124739 m.124739 type:complete len:162 (+) comp14479_c0_seq4:3-488(+)